MLLVSFLLASDDPKRPSPTVNTQPESRGWLNLYPLLILPAAALLIKLCYKIIKRKHNLNLNSHRLGSECSEAVVNLNNSDATHLAASLEATSIIFWVWTWLPWTPKIVMLTAGSAVEDLWEHQPQWELRNTVCSLQPSSKTLMETFKALVTYIINNISFLFWF